MKLLTSPQYRQMMANGRWNTVRTEQDQMPDDFRPVVKLFCPWSVATWLLTELDPEEPVIAFGLCDLGHRMPELGRVSLIEIAAVRGPGGLTIERDRHFRAAKTLHAYAEDARRHGRVVA